MPLWASLCNKSGSTASLEARPGRIVRDTAEWLVLSPLRQGADERAKWEISTAAMRTAEGEPEPSEQR